MINYSANILERLDTISMSDGDHKLEIEMKLKIEDFDTVFKALLNKIINLFE